MCSLELPNFDRLIRSLFVWIGYFGKEKIRYIEVRYSESWKHVNKENLLIDFIRAET